MELLQAPFVDRANFGGYLNSKNLLGDAVEVGTQRGVFASALLSQWYGRILFCVDPWADLREYREQAETLHDRGATRDDDMAEARRLLDSQECSRNKYSFVRLRSFEAAIRFDRESLDFVYLDGNHYPAEVWKDLATWWPKVKPGGILAGHDVVCPGEIKSWGRGIQEMLFRFADGMKLDVQLVVELKSLPWSFLIEKPNNDRPDDDRLKFWKELEMKSA